MPPRRTARAAVAPTPMPEKKPHGCEEASTLSGKFYIPCNRPAVAIVGWKGRNDTPIRMCEMCEDHNIKNRGGYRVEVYYSGEPVKEPPAPAASHNSVLTDNDLVAKNHELEDTLKAAQKKLDEWAKPHKEQLAEVKQILFARLNERGSESTRTEAGTAYISTLMNVKIENREQLFDFIADNWDEVGGEISLSIKIEAVRTHMENNNGQLPPGVSVSYYSRLNVNRS